jgi:putative transposase
MIVGWQLATHLRTELVMDALEMANGLRQPRAGLIAHSDRGSQYTSLAYTDRLDELGAAPSVGSRGDAYDNAMAEAWVATFKSELVDGRRFPSFEHTEHETLAWISFYNSERLHEQLGDLPPLEYEQNQLEQNGYPARRPTSSEVAPRSHARARVPQPHDPWEVNDASAGDSTSSRR